MSFLYLYGVVMLFIFMSLLTATIKLKKIIFENPEFAIKLQALSSPLGIKSVLIITLPIIHLITLSIYIWISLMPDDQVIDFFSNIIDKSNKSNDVNLNKDDVSKNIKNLCILLDKCNESINLEFLSYKYEILDVLRQKGYDISDIEKIDNPNEFLLELKKILDLD